MVEGGATPSTSSLAHNTQPSFDNVEKPSSRLTNTQRRESKKRFDAITRRLDKLSSEPERLKGELAATNPSDYEALLAKQAEIDAVEAEISELELEWLELSELLGE